jgi:hypothetical protein
MHRNNFWTYTPLSSLLVLAGMTYSSPAIASGSVSYPRITKSFKSHRACVAALYKAYAADQQSPDRTSKAAQDSGKRISLQTDGVTFKRPNSAQYISTTWFSYSRFQPDLNQNEISHSYEMRTLRCTGREMTTDVTAGYTLSTFEPARDGILAK